MKIGEFSEYFNLPIETIRYYINKGLIIPHVKNNRYYFNEKDIADMKLIIKLKSLKFSLNDIHKIISLKRLSNLDNPDELKDYISIMNDQKNILGKDMAEIKKSLELINEEIYSVSCKKNTHPHRISGVSLNFLNYFACPMCMDSLSLENCNIEGQEITSGVLKCTCGYHALIQDGIVIGQTVDLNRYDGADTERNCYRMMSPELISMVQKAYIDISEHLESIDTDNKLILEDFINNYCFCYNNFSDLNPNALYIISDQYLEVVKLYKSLIDKLELPHKILYISASSHLLPIKEKCVDVYIDFDSANEYAIFNNGYASDAVKKYFGDKSYIIGAFFSFKKNSASITELHRQYPHTWEYCFDWKYFQQHFNTFSKKIVYKNEIGVVTNSGYGESFSYHVNEDPLYLNTYVCK